ncbi:Sodium-dependent phosphate transport protein 3 [Pteropus alecto]|uniref:Sodium-dependent phosphate transport protein 3 n=1 Tax=Pteropus alecto TaxID=9402 RepID=L5JW38_PTEAL|nr:Sodium-dependent phosphate transport protein 3 [Pteropus alecto]
MDEKPPARGGPGFCSLRCGLALVMHLSNLALITQRVGLSIAIVAMVNGTRRPAAPNATVGADAHGDPGGSAQELRPGTSVYEWSPETQGLIFSSINYGIILTLIPSGYLAGIVGAKRVLGAGLLISSLLTLFTPLAADLGVTLVVVIRTAQGMAQVSRHFARPRGKQTGAAFGTFIILCVGGLISQALGWPFIFYIFGSVGCGCCVLWFTVIYDDPVRHPCISVREKEHIVASLAQQAMVRCLPLWAIFTGFFSHFWLCTIVVTYLPTYISSVLHVNLRDVRLLLPSLCAVALPFAAPSYAMTLTLLILIPGTSNLCDSGFIINTLDVAPRYASFLMGVSRGFGLVAGIMSATATGFLISQDSVSGWRNVFFLSAAVNVFGLAFYLTFGQAEIQDWAKERTLTRL